MHTLTGCEYTVYTTVCIHWQAVNIQYIILQYAYIDRLWIYSILYYSMQTFTGCEYAVYYVTMHTLTGYEYAVY